MLTVIERLTVTSSFLLCAGYALVASARNDCRALAPDASPPRGPSAPVGHLAEPGHAHRVASSSSQVEHGTRQ